MPERVTAAVDDFATTGGTPRAKSSNARRPRERQRGLAGLKPIHIAQGAIAGVLVMLVCAGIYYTRRAPVPDASARGDSFPTRAQRPAVVGLPAIPPPVNAGPVLGGAARQLTVDGDAHTVRFLRVAPPIPPGARRPHADRGPCTNCHEIMSGPAVPPPVVFAPMPPAQAPPETQSPPNPLPHQPMVAPAPTMTAPAPLPMPLPMPMVQPMQPMAQPMPQPMPQASPSTAPPIPAQDPSAMARPWSWTAARPGPLPFSEVHWQGLELIRTSPMLLSVLGLPPDVPGVVIDETTPPADTQGFVAGDLITTVGGVPTPNLESFMAAADLVRDHQMVQIDLMRQRERKSFVLAAPPRLGNANGETAPQIPPGAIRPHGDRGPCTNCHRIGTGGNLKADLGDALTTAAPPIRAGQRRPHADRGPCAACHTIQ